MDNPKDGLPEDLITIAVPGGPPSSQWSCCCVKTNKTSISVSVLHALEAYLPPLDFFSLDCHLRLKFLKVRAIIICKHFSN